MVKAPGYMDNEYEATKARLNQKYGGNRRQVQAHLDGLRKMRPIHADNPRKLERFANIVERTVVSLKENKKFADLEGGTLYATALEKLPQALLSQYYRWVKEREAWSPLRSCDTGLLRKLSTRYKHQKLSMVFPVLDVYEERA